MMVRYKPLRDSINNSLNDHKREINHYVEAIEYKQNDRAVHLRDKIVKGIIELYLKDPKNNVEAEYYNASEEAVLDLTISLVDKRAGLTEELPRKFLTYFFEQRWQRFQAMQNFSTGLVDEYTGLSPEIRYSMWEATEDNEALRKDFPDHRQELNWRIDHASNKLSSLEMLSAFMEDPDFSSHRLTFEEDLFRAQNAEEKQRAKQAIESIIFQRRKTHPVFENLNHAAQEIKQFIADYAQVTTAFEQAFNNKNTKS